MKKKMFFVLAVMAALALAVPAGADVKEAQALLKDVHWLGHDTFKIKGEKVMYTDPFRIKEKDGGDKADIIVISHEHHDHCSPQDVAKIRKPDTVIVTTPSCAAKLSGPVKTAKRGDVVNIGDIRIEAVPAYNIGKKYHPKDADGVGYIVTWKGKRLYFAGDTDHIPEMKTFKDISVAFLPVSGVYVMTEEEAVKAALDIRPDIAVPMHYGAIVGTRMNAEVFAQRLKGKVVVVIMKEE